MAFHAPSTRLQKTRNHLLVGQLRLSSQQLRLSSLSSQLNRLLSQCVARLRLADWAAALEPIFQPVASIVGIQTN